MTGPTAAGKTAVGLELARRLGAEILSLDSMAVYRGLDIGTAKPSPAELAAVPHHLIDLCEPSEDFSIAQYLAQAGQAVAEVRSRGRVPLFVGGTPFYLKALLHGLTSGPEPNWELRERLFDEAAQSGGQALHARLCAVDPAAAARLHPNDLKRVVRALEVYETSGQRISAGQTHGGAEPAAQRVFVLEWPREELNTRIDTRVSAMFAGGWIDEVQRLLAVPGGLGRTARQAVGYREIAEQLQGLRSLADTIRLVQLRTRQFAKRQLTWFRSLAECRGVTVSAPFDAQAVAEQIVRLERAG
ncbi:MAG: tRNA (adenosine(37)-N6)-dimethylallyltransferase MiaA [Pirellulales bacterium]